MRISSIEQMRNMDRRAIEDFEIPELLLMENAAMAMVRVLARKLDIRDSRFIVLCGSGNNGGDGLALARMLISYGGRVHVALAGEPERLSGSTKQNYDMLVVQGIIPEPLEESTSRLATLGAQDVIIDALLGTGIGRPVTGAYAEAVGGINASPARVLSVDIPSGINGDTGQVMGVAVEATWTVTFGAPKTGNLLHPGYAHCGELFTSPISFPPNLYEHDQLRVSLNTPVGMPQRPVAGHKGTFGDALFVAGAGSYYGAPFLSAYAMMKAGGGYSRLATPRSMVPHLAQLGCELVFVPQEETTSGAISLSNLDKLVSLAAKEDFVVVGPGLSLEDEAQALVQELVAKTECPLLIDGDGITAIHKDLDRVRSRSHPTVLTPHMGEMSRLVGKSVSDIEADRLAVLRQATADLNAIIVLKGAHSLIGYPDGQVYINLSGNSGMATAGTGDVLTGVIAAMVGLGLGVEEAVRMGVFVHGLAGDLAAAEIGTDGITARDLLNHLPAAVAEVRSGKHTGSQGHYLIPTV